MLMCSFAKIALKTYQVTPMTTKLAISGNAYIAAELAGPVLTLSGEFPADSGFHYGPHTSEFTFLDRNAAFRAYSALPAVGADYESFERLVSVLHDRALEGIGRQR